MHPNDPEKDDQADFVQRVIDNLGTITEGAKMREVVPLLKIIPSSQIELDPAPGTSNTYHSFANGFYADIFKGTMTCDNGSTKIVAVKVFRNAHLTKNTNEVLYQNRLLREYEVWGRANHRNVLRLEGLLICKVLTSPGLVSEFKEHGDLLGFLSKGLEFDRLAMKVVHGDLTMSNVLVDSDKDLYFPLITDFGKSRVHEKSGYTTEAAAALTSRPPELLAHADPDPATNKDVLFFSSDVYSFSMVLLHLIADKAPYELGRVAQWVLISEIAREKDPLRPTPETHPLPDPSHKFCWPIMQACWKYSPKERITSKEAYERLCHRDNDDNDNRPPLPVLN